MPRRSIPGNKPVNYEQYRGNFITFFKFHFCFALLLFPRNLKLSYFRSDESIDLVVENVPTEGLTKLKQFISAKCDFEYEAERFTMEFASENISYEPKSMKVSFRKQTIAQTDFAPRDTLLTKVFRATISFSKCPIDFFGFGTDRFFTVALVAKSGQGAIFTSTFKFALPVVKQSELHFRPPGTRYPDEVTRAVCRQGFKLNKENSRSELQLVIRLEEFKLQSKTERFEVYGYTKMLEVFLDVENSFELDLVQTFNLPNQKIIKVNATAFKIQVSTDKSHQSLNVTICFLLDCWTDPKRRCVCLFDSDGCSLRNQRSTRAQQTPDQSSHLELPSELCRRHCAA